MVTFSNFLDATRREAVKNYRACRDYNDSIQVVEGDTPAGNQKTWQVFMQAVSLHCGDRTDAVVARVRSRYHEKLDANNTSKLCVKHVLAVEAAFADILRSHLPIDLSERKSIPERVKIPPERAVYKIRGGVPGTSLWQNMVTSPIYMDHKRLQLYNEVEKLTLEEYIERLSKAIVSHPLQEGMILPAPDGKGGVDYYEVALLGGKMGMEICALAPFAKDSDLSPLIICQPTQMSMAKQAVPTILNDFAPNMGKIGYEESQEVVKKLMENPRFQGGLIGAGYSLGGLHLAYLIKDYPERFSHVFFHSDPSFPDPKDAEEFAAMVNQESWTSRLEGVIYRPLVIDENGKKLADPVYASGTKHLGWGVKSDHPCVKFRVQELRYSVRHAKSRKAGLKERHVRRFLDANPAKKDRLERYIYEIEENDHLLDNSKRTDNLKWVEPARQFFGAGLIYPLLECIWSFCQALLSIFLFFLFGEEEQKA